MALANVRTPLMAALLSALVLTTGCEDKDKTDGATGKAATSGTVKSKSGAVTKGTASPAGAARAHLSSSCELVARIDVSAALQADVIKTNLVPALKKAKEASAKSAKEDDKNLTAFLEQTGIDPLKDITEVAVCVTKVKDATGHGEPDFALILGGNFKKGAVVPALQKTSKKDKLEPVEVGGVKALTDKKKEMYIGQAADGTVVVARSEAAFKQALSTSDAATSTFKLPLDKSWSVVVPAKTMAVAMEAGGKDNPFKDQAGKVGRAAMSMDLKGGVFEARIAMTDDKAATELAGVIKMLMGQMTKDPAPPGPAAMFAAVAKNAKIESKGKELVITVTVPKAQMEAFAKDAAKGIERELK